MAKSSADCFSSILHSNYEGFFKQLALGYSCFATLPREILPGICSIQHKGTSTPAGSWLPTRHVSEQPSQALPVLRAEQLAQQQPRTNPGPEVAFLLLL